ncbi:hypothetical protein HPT27_15750 [Permianibacter sp. IMCC34836]|uniref:BACON domain-containing protein n=1 Tax=Permianibacter fluminis TaxID=2738515 RepID=UPI001556F237|nr:BACON domain-containing carbohydrate-binding protein [Permianibacter fluminis]NQD38476.1 hypothetical protein [Permianibacter fluminis]
MQSLWRYCGALLISTLAACSGGGGSGGSDSSGGASLSVSTSSISVDSVFGAGQINRQVTVTFSGNVLVAGSPPGSSLPNWITINGGGSSSPATVTLSISPDVIGTQTATVRFGTGPTAGDIKATKDVVVTMRVSDGFGFPQHQLDASGYWKSPYLGSETIVLNNNNLNWQLSSDAAWLSVGQTSGTGSALLNISLDTAELPVGQHTGHINVQTPDGSKTASFPVVFTQLAPTLTLTPEQLKVSANELEKLSDSLHVYIGGPGGTIAVPFTLDAVNDLQFSASNGTTGSTDITVTAAASAAALAPGIYSRQITAHASVPGAVLTGTTTVQLRVEARELLIQNPGVALTHGPDHDRLSASIPVLASDGQSANFDVASDQPWLTATRSGMQVSVVANPTGLSNGLHFAEVAISSAMDAQVDSIRVGFYVFDQAVANGDKQTFENYESIILVDPVRPYMYFRAGFGGVLGYNIYTGEKVLDLDLKAALDLYVTEYAAISSDGRRAWLLCRNNSADRIVTIDLEQGALLDETWPAFQSGGSNYSLTRLRLLDTDYLLTGNGELFNADTRTAVSYSGGVSYDSSMVLNASEDGRWLMAYGNNHASTFRLLQFKPSRNQPFAVSQKALVSFDYPDYVTGSTISPDGDNLLVSHYIGTADNERYHQDGSGTLADAAAPTHYVRQASMLNDGRFYASRSSYDTPSNAVVLYSDAGVEQGRIDTADEVWYMKPSSDGLRLVLEIGRNTQPGFILQSYPTLH